MTRMPLRRTWTKDEDVRLLALLREGKSIPLIASVLKRSSSAISTRKSLLERPQQASGPEGDKPS